MLVVKAWEAWEENPPNGTSELDWTQRLDGTQVVVSNYSELSLPEFLVEFEHHNNINERMSGGELLNAKFHGFPEDVLTLINANPTLKKHKRLQDLSFLGYLLTGQPFNARSVDVMAAVEQATITAQGVEEAIHALVKLDDLSEQIVFALKDSKGVRKPTSKSDQATLLRLLMNSNPSTLSIEQLRKGWISYTNATKEQAQRESTGEGYKKLAGFFFPKGRRAR